MSSYFRMILTQEYLPFAFRFTNRTRPKEPELDVKNPSQGLLGIHSLLLLRVMTLLFRSSSTL